MDNIVFKDEFDIKKIPFENAANIETIFLLWMETLLIEKLTKLLHDYDDTYFNYDQNSIEVLKEKNYNFKKTLS